MLASKMSFFQAFQTNDTDDDEARNGIKRVLFVTQDVEEIGCEGEYMGQS